MDKNTYLHAVDERLDIPNRIHPAAYTITIKDGNGNELQAPPFHTHYTEGLEGAVPIIMLIIKMHLIC